MKHLSAWCGGALLCCSIVGFAALTAERADGLAWAGLLWSVLSHAAAGALQIEGGSHDRARSRTGLALSVGLALFWSGIQAAIALTLAVSLSLHLEQTEGMAALVTGCAGLSLVLWLVWRASQSASQSSFAECSIRSAQADIGKPLRN